MGQITLEAMRKHGEPDWQQMRESLLLAGANWLWTHHTRQSGNKPDLLLRTASPWQKSLEKQLQPLLDQVFAQEPIWKQLEELARLGEQAAPAYIRRQAGIFYTPGTVAALIVRQTWQRWLEHRGNQPWTEQNYLDPACGSGLFLWQVFALIAQEQKDPEVLAAIIQHAFGCDLDELALQVADFGFALFWQKHFPTLPRPRPRLACLNALAAGTSEQLRLLEIFPELKQSLGLLISNPPYIGERLHKELFLPLRKEPWSDDYRGRGDLYYYFFLLALKISQKNTLTALLTPSYYRTATAAAHLRELLFDLAHILEIIDFGNLRLFPAAAGHHSLLTVFQIAASPDAAPARVQQYLGKSADRKGLEVHLSELESGLGTEFHLHHNLFQGPEKVLVWQDNAFTQILQHMAASQLHLTEKFDVRQGIVTGADNLSSTQQLRWNIQAEPGTGIFVVNAQQHQKLLHEIPAEWFKPWYKNSDIKPWQARETPETWLIYCHRQCVSLPDALARHLQPFKKLLEQRREVQLGRIPWWQLQWPRDPSLFTRPKLVLPQRAHTGVAALTPSDWYASADVYFIVAQDSDWSLKALCCLLNSPLYTFWWHHRGKRKGHLLELYHAPLSQTPLPVPARLNLLESIYTQAHLEVANLPFQGQKPLSENLMQRLHQTVCELFGLTDQQTTIVWTWYSSHKVQ